MAIFKLFIVPRAMADVFKIKYYRMIAEFYTFGTMAYKYLRPGITPRALRFIWKWKPCIKKRRLQFILLKP
jgi:hypothetical protein